MALIASYSSIPSFAARAAHKDKYCSGITGESVVMETRIPALFSTPGVLKDFDFNSNFVL